MSIRNLSCKLVSANVKHIVVKASSKFQGDAVAELLYIASLDRADAEIGDTEELGYFVKFSFKKNEFDKYIFEEAKELKRSGISIDDIKKSISKNNLDALSKSGFIAILREDNDGAMVTEYYPINKGELVWSNIEKRQNEFDIERDGEEFDLLENDDEELSETDED